MKLTSLNVLAVVNVTFQKEQMWSVQRDEGTVKVEAAGKARQGRPREQGLGLEEALRSPKEAKGGPSWKVLICLLERTAAAGVGESDSRRPLQCQ
ncbi:hypothetical protein P7K49_034701 [Saguinus oedipus]|uniref:Uncharacterized protein n=1 Tax=Saguinus oedipus TaxID=9490 RepID=A0ABQ9TW33_SAGOE|nr:hypothetical protein P7K49_034701 [Saguinus oedipus]